MKIIVRGLGMVCRLGKSTSEIIDNIKKVPSIDLIKVDSKTFPVSITPTDWLPKKSDKVFELAKLAIDEAIEKSQLSINENNTAILTGCTKGYSSTISKHLHDSDVSDYTIANTNQLNIDLAKHYQLPFLHISNAACATGAQILNKAINLIQSEVYEQIIVCMSEASISNEIISAFNQLGVLTTNPKGMLPFDKNHSGFHIGDGSAALILTKETNSNIINNFIISVASGTDATHFSEFKNGPITIINLIDQVIKKADLTLNDIQHLNLHGTATKVNDLMEMELMNQLTSRNPNLKFSSTKQYTGHLLGASGLLETVLCFLLANNNWIPSLYIREPLLNLNNNLIIDGNGRSVNTKYFINVSYGLGGPIGIVLGESY